MKMRGQNFWHGWLIGGEERRGLFTRFEPTTRSLDAARLPGECSCIPPSALNEPTQPSTSIVPAQDLTTTYCVFKYSTIPQDVCSTRIKGFSHPHELFKGLWPANMKRLRLTTSTASSVSTSLSLTSGRTRSASLTEATGTLRTARMQTSLPAPSTKPRRLCAS